MKYKELAVLNEYITEQAVKLMGHALRADNKDRMSQVTFRKTTGMELIPRKRKVGRPRESWTESIMPEI